MLTEGHGTGAGLASGITSSSSKPTDCPNRRLMPPTGCSWIPWGSYALSSRRTEHRCVQPGAIVYVVDQVVYLGSVHPSRRHATK